jgi:asparagine synthase (glutamine-hydrolysing)
VPEFIIKLNPHKKSSFPGLMYQSITDFKNLKVEENRLYIKGRKLHYFSGENHNGILIGDPILDQDDPQGIIGGVKFRETIHRLPGFYYCIQFLTQEFRYEFFNSHFGILPVYYIQDRNHLWISSHLKLILGLRKGSYKMDRHYMAEMALFNYAFDSRTPFEEIKTLPSHSLLSASPKDFTVIKYSNVAKYFCKAPDPVRTALPALIELFTKRTRIYLSGGNTAISMTGGFDGRTLVSAAMHHKFPVSAFSFGTRDNPDLYIPLRQSRALGLNFIPIILDENYQNKSYFPMATQMIRDTGGYPGFLHAHFPYSASLLSGDFSLIANGSFGSEIFRALHIQGMVTSRSLVSLFAEEDPVDFLRSIKKDKVLAFLNLDNLKTEIQETGEKCIAYKRSLADLGNVNHMFYTFIFEEAFRKFFGPQIASQFPFLDIRSPFIDNEFLLAILQTSLAGPNNEFFTHNPVRRMKGQLFYSIFINKHYPQLGRMETGKGYRPSDLLSLQGKIAISYGYIKKRIIRKFRKESLNNLAILSAVRQNRHEIDRIPLDEELFNVNKIRERFNSPDWMNDRDDLLKIFSINYLLSGQ